MNFIHKLRFGGNIERLADGEPLAKEELASLFTHLRACLSCRRHYDLTVGATRLLASGGESASRPNHEMIAAFAARVMPAPAVTKTRPMPWLVPALAATAAVLLVVLFVARQPKEEDFGVRTGTSAGFAVRVFCDKPGAAPVALEQTPTGRCTDGALYRFAYTSEQACGVEIKLVTQAGEQKRVWPEETTARQVTPTTALRPLGAALSASADAVRFEVTCRTEQSLKEVTIPLGKSR